MPTTVRAHSAAKLKESPTKVGIIEQSGKTSYMTGVRPMLAVEEFTYKGRDAPSPKSPTRSSHVSSHTTTYGLQTSSSGSNLKKQSSGLQREFEDAHIQRFDLDRAEIDKSDEAAQVRENDMNSRENVWVQSLHRIDKAVDEINIEVDNMTRENKKLLEEVERLTKENELLKRGNGVGREGKRVNIDV